MLVVSQKASFGFVFWVLLNFKPGFKYRFGKPLRRGSALTSAPSGDTKIIIIIIEENPFTICICERLIDKRDRRSKAIKNEPGVYE